MTRSKRGISIIEVAILSLVVVVVISVLSPVIATGVHTSALAQCQANLRRLGGAFRMYLADWDRVYPTNKVVPTSPPVKEVPLALLGELPPGAKPMKFYSPNGVQQVSWVGALYDYVGPVTTPGDTTSVWKCPAASADQYAGSVNYKFRAAVSYVINYNLLERPEGESRHDSKLMLCREFDRLLNACARAGTAGTKMGYVTGSGTSPNSPFLTGSDAGQTGLATNKFLHGMGSNILFTDGHVKCFSATVFQASTGVQSKWDSSSVRWVNGGTPQGVIHISR